MCCLLLHTHVPIPVLVSRDVEVLTATLGVSQRNVGNCVLRVSVSFSLFFLIIFNVFRLTSIPCIVRVLRYYQREQVLLKPEEEA